MEQPPSPTKLLRGRIENLRVKSATASLFFKEGDSAKMGATAIAATAMGLSGIGVGLAASATSLREEVEVAEFDLDGEQVQACLWKTPFKEGDEVEVVAERWGGKWKAFGISRPKDRLIALYPHSSRGRLAHLKATARLWVGVGLPLVTSAVVFMLIIWVASGVDDYSETLFFLGIAGAGGFLLYGLIAFLVSRRYMPFVEIAEGVFRTLGWQNPERVDLPAISKRKKRSGDPGEMGYFFFRY